MNLASPIQEDGIGKILGKGDLERLKSAANRPAILQAEQTMAMNWKLLVDHSLHETPGGYAVMGRALIRTMLFLAKKQKQGREDLFFENLAEISTTFGAELLELQSGSRPMAASGESQEVEAPAALEENMLFAYVFMFSSAWFCN